MGARGEPSRSASEDLRLLGRELLLCEDPLLLELREVLELLDRVERRCRRRRLAGGLGLVVGGGVLRGPARGLPAGHAVADGRRGTGDGGGSGDAAKLSGHEVSYFIGSWSLAR